MPLSLVPTTPNIQSSRTKDERIDANEYHRHETSAVASIQAFISEQRDKIYKLKLKSRSSRHVNSPTVDWYPEREKMDERAPPGSTHYQVLPEKYTPGARGPRAEQSRARQHITQ
jgi:hypothetical protein